MKAKLFISTLVVSIFMMLGQQAFAQVDDTLPPWFRAPGTLLTPDAILKAPGTFIMPAATYKAAKPISANMAKSMKLPRSVKRLPSPITLRKDGKCYRIGCDNSCKDCQLLWLDKNKDRKIQPRKELRCVCLSTKEQCKLRGKQVPCKR